MVGKSVVTLDGLSTNQILDLLHKAEYIDSHRKEVAHTCDGRVLATLFYEPSTRTRLSFETAMLRLGGKVIGFAGAQLASVTKGESIADTLKTVSNYVDVVAIRHPKEGAALVASRAASVPVINAGDGGHMHPTQTLADLATLQSRFGRITDLTVVYSLEVPVEPVGVPAADNGRHPPASMAFVPPAAGFLMASYAVRDLLGLLPPAGH